MSSSMESQLVIRESRISKNPMDLVRFAMNDLEAGNPDREAFTEDEIALQAMMHHPRYMKRQRLLKRGRVPGPFRMPFMSMGFMDLQSSGELGCRFEDEEGNVVYDLDDPAFTEDDRPKNLGSYNRMYYTIKLSTEETPINAAQNGNGASPTGQVPEALTTDVTNTP